MSPQRGFTRVDEFVFPIGTEKIVVAQRKRERGPVGCVFVRDAGCEGAGCFARRRGGGAAGAGAQSGASAEQFSRLYQ